MTKTQTKDEPACKEIFKEMMLKQVFILFFVIQLFFTPALKAHENEDLWTKPWLEACQFVENENYDDALPLYSKAIAEINLKKDDNYLHLYNERGQLLSLLGDYLEAIKDFSTVIDLSSTVTSDVINAWWNRYYCYGKLHNLDQCKYHYEILQKIDPNIPKIEFINDSIIIKTIYSWSDEDKISLSKNFARIGICEQPNDVIFSSSGVCSAKMSPAFRKGAPCCKNCGKNKPCIEKKITALSLSHQIVPVSSYTDEKKIQTCQDNCDSTAYYAAFACTPLPKKCKYVCLACIEPLRRTCYWCCQSGSFYTKCIRPLEDFFPPPCDPAWD